MIMFIRKSQLLLFNTEISVGNMVFFCFLSVCWWWWWWTTVF